MNCPNCGRELAEGEVCNCAEQSNPIQNNPQPAVPPQQPQPQQPQPQQQPPQPQYVPPQQPQQPPHQQYMPPVPMADSNYYNPQQPVMQPVARTDYPEGYKIKKKVVAIILAVTLGPLGIHNFYLGNNNKALAQLLVCVLGSMLLGLGYFVAWTWALVEAVLMLTEKMDMDSNGFKIMTFEESMAKAIKESSKEDEAEEEE